MFMPATKPNSFNIWLCVNANTAKPMAAARLQNSVTIPILSTIITSDFFLSPVSLYAV